MIVSIRWVKTREEPNELCPQKTYITMLKERNCPMDELKRYRETIQSLLEEFTTRQYANPDISELHNKTVFDSTHDRYLVISDGWEKDNSRIHGCLVDIEIINEKIWIQRDETDYGIASDLLAAGIPKDKIVLGFKDPSIRPYTGFAIV